MPIIQLEEWKRYEESNHDDPYGKACVDVARRTMELLDEQRDEVTPDDTHNLIRQAERQTSSGGITGFMAALVASMIMRVHSRGEEFRKAWNTSYGCSEDKAKGRLVNPAIVTIGDEKQRVTPMHPTFLVP